MRQMDSIRLSVVIPCLNEADTIGNQLTRLAQQTWTEPWEIVVADNGSTDGTQEVVYRYQQEMKNLRLVDAGSRKGVNYPRNVGAAAARGEFVVFCDADDEVQPGWLEAMGEALRTHDVVAGRLDSERLNEHWSVALRGLPQNRGLMGFTHHLPFAGGANLGVKRSLHDRIGGFDEDFLGGADDVDYCWRLQEAGAELHFEPRAVIAYRYRNDLRSLFVQGRFYALGVVSIYKKHRSNGLPHQRHPWLLGVVTWLGLIRHVPIPPTRQSLAYFLWTFGWKLGMLEGSIRHRTLLLSARGVFDLPPVPKPGGRSSHTELELRGEEMQPQSGPVRLSVVIPCLDSAEGIAEQLDRLTRETWSERWEVIVADNGSTDATREVVRCYGGKLPALRLVDASARPGAAHARNVGAAAARGEFAVFCDADDEVQPGWLAAMGEALRTHDVVAGRLDSHKRNEDWSFGLRTFPQADGLMSFTHHLPFAASANLGVRRTLHDRVGGFDEDHLGAGEDVDYCWRLQQAGAELYFEPRAVVAYRFRSDLRSLFQQARAYAIGMVSIYRKHRRRGLPEQSHPWLFGILTWLGVARRLPVPPSKRSLAAFMWALGWRFGMLEGSIRNRVLLLSDRGIM